MNGEIQDPRRPAEVAVIIVNWNGCADTIACLSSLMGLRNSSARFIISDNASSDGSVAAFQAWLESVASPSEEQVVTRDSLVDAHNDKLLTIIEIGENLGFAAGNNAGIKLALKDPHIKYLWLLNNDTEVHADSLLALRKRFTEDPKLGICGSTLVYGSNPGMVQAVGVHYSLFMGGGYQIGQGVSVQELPSRASVEGVLTYVPGASMLVSRAFVETVGPMEESYFLYCEELDWTLRNKGRFRFGWAPSSIVVHKEGGSIGTNTMSRASDLSVYYQAVNILRLLARYRPYYLPLTAVRLFLKAARFLIHGDRAGFRAMRLAAADFLLKRRRVGGTWLSRYVKA